MTTTNTATLMAGGDIDPRYEPTDQFADLILPELRKADLRFGQCERTYSEKASVPHFSQQQGGVSYGQSAGRISFHPRMASVWKTAGIDVISIASNHTMDCGPEAFLDTIQLFRSWGKHVIGGGENIDEARKPAIVECNGVKIAFLGYCSVLPIDHDANQKRPGIAPMRAHTYYLRGGDPHEEYQPGTPQRIYTEPHAEDLRALQRDIKRAREMADAVVMSIHWGVHHVPKYIADYQPVVAHAAIDAGADLILGHHPHILKAIEVYKGKVCFYGLGNFMITGTGRLVKDPLWGFCWYRVDSECKAPGGMYRFPIDNRNTMIAKVVFSRNGVERVSFLPAYINPKAQPAVVSPGDPKFQEIIEYIEWISDQYPHKFRVDGNEVVVTA